MHRIREHLSIETVKVPEIRANEVIVKIKAAGICHSDLNYRDGVSPVATLPVILGHEISGVVVDKGENVEGVEGGSRVCVHYVKSCGECVFCGSGRENLCENYQMIGKDVDEMEEGGKTNLGIFVDVYGKNMQEDFESVLERRIHQFINFTEGGWHTGQRNLVWIRLSKNGVANGLTFKDFGRILYNRMHQEFGAIVNKVQITIVTDEDELQKRLRPLEAIGSRRASGRDDDGAADVGRRMLAPPLKDLDHPCEVISEKCS